MPMETGVFPFELDLFLADYDGPAWAVAPFRHRSGWLMLSEARLETAFGEHRRLLTAAVSDHGEVYYPHVAARLLDMPASRPRDAASYPPEALDAAMDAAYWDFLGTVDLMSLRQLAEAQEDQESRLAAFERECAALEAKIGARQRLLRQERRSASLMPETQLEIEARLRRLDDMLDELRIGLRAKARAMRAETEALEEDVLAGLTDYGDVLPLAVLRWCARPGGWRSAEVRLPESRPFHFVADAFRSAVDGRSTERLAMMRVFESEQEF